MKRITSSLSLIIFIAIFVGLMSAFPEDVLAQTASPQPVEEVTPPPPTSEPGPGGGSGTSTAQPDFTPTPTSIVLAASEQIEAISAHQLFTFEGPITRWISDLSSRYGWDKIDFLGLSLENWINLALSVLFFLLIYQVGKRFLYRGLNALLTRTALSKVDEFLEITKPQVDWLVLTFAVQISLARLNFLGSGLRVILYQVFFVAYLTIITIILWKGFGFATDTLLRHERSEGDIQRLSPVYMVAKRVSQALLIIGYTSIMLSYFGINITAFAAALGIGGLALSLAAQDTLADAISGFLILLDQPFRIGDRIEISGLGTWGDVVDIGTRTTRIRTRDNRLVIIPNSAIAKDQVINYTYPDPRYRVQIEVGIDYGCDIKIARQTAINAVRKVEGVLLDKPIEALFVDFGDSTIILRIRWWISSYVDTRRMFDRVNEALLNAFNEAGISLPNITYDVNLKVDGQNVRQFPGTEANPDQPQKQD